MRFDYSAIPAHPRKVFSIINNFVNNNVYLEHSISCCALQEMTIEEYFKKVDSGESLYENTKVIFHVRKGENCYAINSEDNSSLNCEIRINFQELMSLGVRAVIENAKRRAPMLKNFSNITLALLHEVGHFMTADKIPEDYVEEKMPLEELFKIFKSCPTERMFQRKMQNWYCNKLEERLATDWAIEFLSNAENRKKTKAFEREFFKAFRG